ncbi:MAG TPA: SRPBCC family protein, partial [Stellaceae bacterium]|nr:SRPBCC family protein [Stellaceae bacterium]
ADDAGAPLPQLIAPGQPLFATAATEVAANWKLLLESFIEGYHIRPTHPKTFLPYGFDNLNLIDLFGRNSRVTYPFQRIRKLAAIAPAERRVEGLLTYVYHLFPNALVNVFSHHTKLVILEPLAVDRTLMLAYAVARGASEDALAAANRDSDFVENAGGAEDRAVVCDIQRGLGGGANEVFTFGQFESAIVHFHRMLATALGEPTTARR